METQELQAAIKIPPLAYQNYRIDLLMRIQQERAHYSAFIAATGLGSWLDFPIEISPADLVKLNEQLKEVMESIARESVQGEKPTSEESEVQLRRLAYEGNYAFKKVFGNDNVLTKIGEALDLNATLSIQVASEDFSLPWELIYPASLEDPLSYGHFWGMKYIISRFPRPGGFDPPVIPVGPRPKLGLLTYDGLPSVVAKEIPFFERLDRDGTITLLKLRALDPLQTKREQELTEFKNFWRNALNLAHFACHASYEVNSPDQSFIKLTDDFIISLKDLEVYDLTINNHPLIIMNACETGNLNPQYTSHFAIAFLKYGARGVVATECAVPDTFAANFAEQLYTHLLAGKPLGDSLLTARRYFLEKYLNPSGLLYSMYAPPTIQLRQIGE